MFRNAHDTGGLARDGGNLGGLVRTAGRHAFRALAAAGGQPQIPDETRHAELADAFTGAMAEVVSGVCVVTAAARDGAPCGLLVTSLCSYSADPPAVLVCLGSHGRARTAITTAAAFGVHVLRDAQEHVARWFATDATHKFAAVDWEWDHGVPALAHAHVVAYLRCARAAVKRHADHRIVIGHVEHVETAPGEPLVYVRRRMGWRLDDATVA